MTLSTNLFLFNNVINIRKHKEQDSALIRAIAIQMPLHVLALNYFSISSTRIYKRKRVRRYVKLILININ